MDEISRETAADESCSGWSGMWATRPKAFAGRRGLSLLPRNGLPSFLPLRPLRPLRPLLPLLPLLLAAWTLFSCAPLETTAATAGTAAPAATAGTVGTAATAERSAALRTVPPESVGLSSERLDAVLDLFDDLVAERKIAGGAVLVARKGGVALLGVSGAADVEAGTPMAPDTIFRICSMTKPITSAGVLMLVEEGRLALDDPVGKHLPELRGMQVAVRHETEAGEDYELVPAEREITIRDLLVHTSGITYGFWGREVFSKLYEDAGVSDGLAETEGTMRDNVKRLAALPLMFQPGTAWEYGLSTDILGCVIETVTALTLDEFFRERIFEPLGMRDTSFLVPPGKRPRLAAVYQPGPEGALEKTIERLPAGKVRRGAAVYSASYPLQDSTRFFSGGAGLVSTVPDYFRFLQMMLGGGELDGRRILSPETVAAMTRPWTGDLPLSITSHGDAFGLGVGVVTEAAEDEGLDGLAGPAGLGSGLGSAGTWSWGGFYHTYFFVDPEEEIVAVAMTQLYPWDHLTLWADLRARIYAAVLP